MMFVNRVMQKVMERKKLFYLLIIFLVLATSNEAIIVPHFDSSTVESL